MLLSGAAANALAILAGGIAGTVLKRGIPEQVSTALSNGLALVILYVGISGSIKGSRTTLTILAFAASVLLMAAASKNPVAKALSCTIKKRLAKVMYRYPLVNGFMNASLFVCAGAMVIVGSLQSGTTGRHEILYSKAVIDFVAVMILASVSGIGTALAAVPIFCYEAILIVAAKYASAFLTAPVVDEINCAGSLLLIGLALNTLHITDIRLGSYLLAPFLVIPLFFALG